MLRRSRCGTPSGARAARCLLLAFDIMSRAADTWFASTACARDVAHRGKRIRRFGDRRPPNWLLAAAVGVMLAACGGTTADGRAGSTDAGPTGPGGGSGGGGGAPGGAGGYASGGVAGSGGGTGRTPAIHRAAATACDDKRPYFDAGAPAVDGAAAGYVSCHTHQDCTNGLNGRCVGNGHDGWRCSYDECLTDSDCARDAGTGSGVCACASGFRSDNNICLVGNCRTDTDCGTSGYCSPSLGDCGKYGGPTAYTGYYCHTPDDECVDDADCGGDSGYSSPYCAYSEINGHWACSTINCVG